MQYDSLKRESRAIQDENKSLLTALRLLSSEIPSETKHTAVSYTHLTLPTSDLV